MESHSVSPECRRVSADDGVHVGVRAEEVLEPGSARAGGPCAVQPCLQHPSSCSVPPHPMQISEPFRVVTMVWYSNLP